MSPFRTDVQTAYDKISGTDQTALSAAFSNTPESFNRVMSFCFVTLGEIFQEKFNADRTRGAKQQFASIPLVQRRSKAVKSGQTVVKRWSNPSQTAVKQRSNSGQRRSKGGQAVVKRWSNGSQTVVKRWSNADTLVVSNGGQTAVKRYFKSSGQTVVKRWSNPSQTAVKRWSNSGQRRSTGGQAVVKRWSNGRLQSLSTSIMLHAAAHMLAAFKCGHE